jgi:pyridinium-3,5-bisthiocarboxylic acid mononucleotide nickel chelatase
VRIAYLDCNSGISGDMTLGALVDAGVDLAAINAGLASLPLPGCRAIAAEVKKKGFRATQITIEHEPEHKHRHLHHIAKMIDASQLSQRQRDLALRIFQKLAEAEAKVHGTSIEKVHFHEVGAVDSIADIVGAAIGWDLLAVDRIVASPVPTGMGAVQIAHGRCSIPAPATAELLRGVPLVELPIACELTTPTGAAILASLVDAYGPVPAMRIDRIGYGAGQKELTEQPNMLRLLVGESVDGGGGEQVWVLETNLDDVSGELIGYCTAKMWEAGALDVYATPIQMKKNRPGVTLSALCHAPQIENLERILFRETTTLGVRRWPVSRHKLERREHVVETALGPVQGKLAWIAGQPAAFSPEFEACSRIAGERGVPLKEVYEAARRAFEGEGNPPGPT